MSETQETVEGSEETSNKRVVIDYSSMISDTAEDLRKKAEEYKNDDGTYNMFGCRLLFLADVKEFPAFSLSKLARKHDRVTQTCKGWVEMYLEGGIDAVTAPIQRSGGGRPQGAPAKLNDSHIDIIREFCDSQHVTSLEQVRDHLLEKLELNSLGLTPIKSLLDRNDLHFGSALYVAEGKAPKRERKPKDANVEAEGYSDDVDSDEVEASEDTSVEAVEPEPEVKPSKKRGRQSPE